MPAPRSFAFLALLASLLTAGQVVAQPTQDAPVQEAPPKPPSDDGRSPDTPPAADDRQKAPAPEQRPAESPQPAPAPTQPPQSGDSPPNDASTPTPQPQQPGQAPAPPTPQPADGQPPAPATPPGQPAEETPSPNDGTAGAQEQPGSEPEQSISTEGSSDESAAAPAPIEIEIDVGVGPEAAVTTPPTAAGDDASTADADEPIDVLVAGTRSSRMAGAAQVIGSEQLERLEYDDAHAVLRQVPGVYVREEDGAGLRPNIAMRGVNPDRSKKVTLMEDGILFGPAPYSAPAAYYFPMMTRMSQVRVIKGAGAVAFGPQTVGGAIDMISRPIPTSKSAGLDLGYGQYGYRKAHLFAGTSDEQVGFLIEGVHVGNDGFKQLPDDANTGAARNEWLVKGSYLVDPTAETTNELSIKLGYSTEASNETYLGLTDEDFEANPNRRYAASALDRMDNHRSTIALTHRLETFDGKYQLQTTAYRHDFFRIWRKFNRLGGASASDVLANPDDPSNAALYGVLSGQTNTSSALDAVWIGPNQREFVSQGLFSRLLWQPVTGSISHKVESGVRLHYDSIERDHSEESFDLAGGNLVPTGAATETTTRNFASTYALAVHLTDAITYRSLTVTPGARVEVIRSRLDDYLADESSKRTLVALMPGLGVYYALLEEWGVFAGAYRGFSPPPPGSPKAIEPEYSINYEVGTRYSDHPTKLEALGFFNDYSNLTDVCTFSNGCANQDLDQQFDAGRARIFGLESTAAYEFELGAFKFPLSAAYTLTFGEFDNSFDSADPIYGAVQKGDELPYVARHQLNAQLAAEYDRYGAYVAGNYVSAVREQAGNEPLGDVQSTDPLKTLDVGVSARLLKFLNLYINARNILDYQGVAAHRPFGARPNAPRWIQGGLKFEL